MAFACSPPRCFQAAPAGHELQYPFPFKKRLQIPEIRFKFPVEITWLAATAELSASLYNPAESIEALFSNPGKIRVNRETPAGKRSWKYSDAGAAVHEIRISREDILRPRNFC
jgi:hypothetical protein